ncbi:dimethylarginine dimethylaminohydrolase family protein [Alteromonas gilva]|uniref:Arginine deiminase family protein n=1 Tax=Alteromonas gilva TaxID=2987522 RepID=A0ABT5KXL2_9ALTE|nr:arginine deiminase family protein [Alteromonas gilva]MDC8829510.1 arginine deiminase family protein [Alteromonas gilva]
MFQNAIVRTPCQAMVNGLTEADLGKPDFELALAQHADYIDALKACGLKVTVLEALEDYPDSCFVEDVALLTPTVAVLTHPGAISRRGEVDYISAAVRKHYKQVETITAPGHVEAGDIMMVNKHFYIGLSARTNQAGAAQMIEHLQTHGYTGSTVTMSELLHLKTGISYLENNHMLTFGEMQSHSDFARFNQIAVPAEEAYAANSVWINDTVLVPKGFPVTADNIARLGYEVREVAMSEFQKIDGGLSCLSLRF